MPFPSPTKPTQTTTMKNVYQAAPLHYVNIGRKLDGDYKFGYDTGKGPSGQSFREEIRLADGTISGTYGVVDELGHKRVVHFSAGKAAPLSHEETTPKPTKAPSSTSTTPSVRKPYSNTIARHFTSPLASFNLANYLHLKTTSPTSMQPTPTQLSIIASQRHSTHQNSMASSGESNRQNKIEPARQSNQQDKIAHQSNQRNEMGSSGHSNQRNKEEFSRQSSLENTVTNSPQPKQSNTMAAARQSNQQNAVTYSPHSNKKNMMVSSRQSNNHNKMTNSHQSNHQNTMTSLRQYNQQNVQSTSSQSSPNQQNVIASPQQSIFHQNIVASFLQTHSGLQNNIPVNSRQLIPTHQNRIVSVPQSTSTQQSMFIVPQQSAIASPHLFSYGVSTEPQKTLMPFMESYRTGSLQRIDKFDDQPTIQNLQMKDAAYLTSTYDPKFEDEYYDSAPPFIDVERLSYNIGTDKNASPKI